MRAVGDRSPAIFRLVLAESLVLGLAGAVLGVLRGPAVQRLGGERSISAVSALGSSNVIVAQRDRNPTVHAQRHPKRRFHGNDLSLDLSDCEVIPPSGHPDDMASAYLPTVK